MWHIKGTLDVTPNLNWSKENVKKKEKEKEMSFAFARKIGYYHLSKTTQIFK